jgi:predicted ATPase
MIYVFGNYELDTQLYELRHAGVPCKLEPQAFDVLAYLIDHRTRVITKQELEEALSRSLLHLQATEFLYETRGSLPRLYTFKHVLTQEAAYQSLLASIRQQLHHRIAHLLVGRFPETAQTQPELLAYHYTEAGFIAQAIDYWQRAGQQALERFAPIEATVRLTRGLELLATLPDTPERRLHELQLQTTLGPAVMTVKGYGAPEVERAYTRARGLCQQVGDTPQLLPVLFGLVRWYTFRQAFQTAQALGMQYFSLAQRLHDPGGLIEASWVLGAVLFYRGELAAARAHLEQGITFYNPQGHRTHAVLYGQDPGVVCLGFAS